MPEQTSTARASTPRFVNRPRRGSLLSAVLGMLGSVSVNARSPIAKWGLSPNQSVLPEIAARASGRRHGKHNGACGGAFGGGIACKAHRSEYLKPGGGWRGQNARRIDMKQIAAAAKAE